MGTGDGHERLEECILMRVIICGDRNWKDEETIEIFIETLPPDTVIIHGGCRGADMIADAMARKHGLEVHPPFFAQWNIYRKGAGPIRNKRMILEGKPDRVVAFHNDLSKSKGTANMLKLAKEHSVPWEVRRSDA